MTQLTAKVFKYETAFPGRYTWICVTCKSENRYFEVECPSCLWEQERVLYGW